MMAAPAPTLVPRQIWAISSARTRELPHTCTPFVLHSGGVINVGGDNYVTLTQDAGFQPPCYTHSVSPPVDPLSPIATEIFLKPEPFYTSTDPQIYAVAAVTAVSYMLVIMLFITPRTFFYGGASSSGGFLGNGGVIRGSNGRGSVIGVGDRPWLQKAATLCVAISLTIVTADMFKWAERQYYHGYQDAQELSEKVIDGLEIRIVRVISETFLWLAQAQTLIRLFPRHKEKLVIKWTAFGLVSLELIFSILNFFVKQGGHYHPRTFNSAIPAMEYLFALTLNLCYAAFIFYYAIGKRRFAFYHQKMRNMPLVALLSLVAVLTPIIFFILDLSQPGVSGWGGYIRWVSAAAASVVVWEWVERIEALEREEKKDGILGREVFDGDEMLDANNSSHSSWRGSGHKFGGYGIGRNNSSSGGGSGTGLAMGMGWRELKSKTRMLQPGRRKTAKARDRKRPSNPVELENRLSHADAGGNPHPDAPENVTSPSRADTASVSSTVYRVRYHPTTEPTPPIIEAPSQESSEDQFTKDEIMTEQAAITSEISLGTRINNGMNMMLHPFRRQRNSPPIEVVQAISTNSQAIGSRFATKSPAKEMGLLRLLHWKNLQKQEVAPAGVIVVPAPQQRASLSHQTSRLSNDSERPEETSTDPQYPDKAESPPVAVINAMRMSPRSELERAHRSSPLSETQVAQEPQTLAGVVNDEPAPGVSPPVQQQHSQTNHDR